MCARSMSQAPAARRRPLRAAAPLLHPGDACASAEDPQPPIAVRPEQPPDAAVRGAVEAPLLQQRQALALEQRGGPLEHRERLPAARLGDRGLEGHEPRPARERQQRALVRPAPEVRREDAQRRDAGPLEVRQPEGGAEPGLRGKLREQHGQVHGPHPARRADQGLRGGVDVDVAQAPVAAQELGEGLPHAAHLVDGGAVGPPEELGHARLPLGHARAPQVAKGALQNHVIGRELAQAPSPEIRRKLLLQRLITLEAVRAGLIDVGCIHESNPRLSH
mmetsp:Transcript_116174/g.339789  ORF Transcript_116174/g.339789 Transcript_116174/m.339789 type:complete len:277 (-) Transcript_116174:184-1014(-)